MQKKKNAGLSRRKFMGASALGATGLSFLPYLGFSKPQQFTSSSLGTSKVRLGFIGLGRQASGLLRNMMNIPNVEIIAGCDVYGVKRERFQHVVAEQYGKEPSSIPVYEKYQDLLQRADVDAVVIATPDFWHALIAIDACRAKKDIYLEKPLTYTVKEGQELVKAVRDNSVVLAVGSQQRSEANFQYAVRMVQKGHIGKVNHVKAHVGQPTSPKPYDLSKESIPADLNWDLWLGPIKPVHYNAELNPPISLDPKKNENIWGAWRWYWETGGGLMTDWGAHMFDIAQWGIGMDRHGPVEVAPEKDNNPLTFTYANGIVMTAEPFDGGTRGVRFIGDKGWIQVSRQGFKSSIPDLAVPEAEKSTINAHPHHVDFIESVIRRKDPIASVEIGHSTCTVCTLGNISNKLGRKLKWNPTQQTFEQDAEAEAMLHYDYENGYSLDA
ncbi:gfo/Idh/MocA family oxidoreductase [Echinicola strongylocentroti]|uniref:Gfo/Idh/MocA family oxidoreductase n=1 Tax=Echinicola strongylocentroti TaxID=1795355 RepID=A0A2Z4IJL7_9BACT|nr:Gfo/Idh/MocA family oxidoreductase [Echinicola strongylocentroti]AWW30718.1 gfo/Idh/MocA family oxidoreductase [Echinicola strongylocentroti]